MGGLGVDYLKYDWGPVDAANMAVMAAALRATGRDVVLSLSNNGAGNILGIIRGLAPLSQSWRATNDINQKWSRVVAIGFSQGPWAPYQSPGHYNDADMLVVGHVGWGVPHPTRLTPDEQYSHISLWCLLGTPLLIGCDLEKLDPFTIGLLTNDEVLAVDQDELSAGPPRRSPRRETCGSMQSRSRMVRGPSACSTWGPMGRR